MKIGAIFEVVDGKLLSVRWKGQRKDCFATCFRDWQNALFLEDFFEKNKKDLQDPFWDLSVEEAVMQAMEEAAEFEDFILKSAKKGTLDGLVFNPVSKNEYSYKRVPSKAYGRDRAPGMLRLYAIKIDSDLYMVTGGAVKLTKRMQDRTHTASELAKLAEAVAWLKSNGIDDATDYGYIEIENR